MSGRADHVRVTMSSASTVATASPSHKAPPMATTVLSTAAAASPMRQPAGMRGSSNHGSGFCHGQRFLERSRASTAATGPPVLFKPPSTTTMQPTATAANSALGFLRSGRGDHSRVLRSSASTAETPPRMMPPFDSSSLPPTAMRLGPIVTAAKPARPPLGIDGSRRDTAAGPSSHIGSASTILPVRHSTACSTPGTGSGKS